MRLRAPPAIVGGSERVPRTSGATRVVRMNDWEACHGSGGTVALFAFRFPTRRGSSTQNRSNFCAAG